MEYKINVNVIFFVSLSEANSAVAIMAMTSGVLLEIATSVFCHGVATNLAKKFGAKYQPNCIVFDAALCDIHKCITITGRLGAYIKRV